MAGLCDSESCEVWEYLNTSHLDQLQLGFLSATPTRYLDNSPSTGTVILTVQESSLWESAKLRREESDCKDFEKKLDNDKELKRELERERGVLNDI